VNWKAVHAALTEIGYHGSATVELPGGDEEYLRDVVQRVDKILEGV
jgi:sugar phosphate isomerase/epimerase